MAILGLVSEVCFSHQNFRNLLSSSYFLPPCPSQKDVNFLQNCLCAGTTRNNDHLNQVQLQWYLLSGLSVTSLKTCISPSYLNTGSC